MNLHHFPLLRHCYKLQETLTTNDLFWLGALGAGCVAGSFCLNYYSRRYVGELSLLPDKRTVRFSTLDFWGNRQVLRGHFGGKGARVVAW